MASEPHDFLFIGVAVLRNGGVGQFGLALGDVNGIIEMEPGIVRVPPAPAVIGKPRRRPQAKPASNVISLHQRIMPRHEILLARWIDAGRRMGLCDASVFLPTRHNEAVPPGTNDYILVWVRENIDPAYMIVPESTGWLVVDAIRQQHLARVRTFAAALHLIRPVLPQTLAA